MSAAIAMAPSPAPHERPSFPSEGPSTATPAAASQAAGQAPSSAQRTPGTASFSASASTSVAPRKPGGSSSPKGAGPSALSKSSPPGSSRLDASRPKIVVKKEPGSPTLSHTRPRPRRLDLSKNTVAASNNPASAVPLSARDGLGIQEVGIACLSPGFVTQDPVMKEQLQRSMSVREQQRNIIEARLQQQSAKGDGPSDRDKEPSSQFAAKTPGMSRRNKAPPGLSIVAPSHEQFANERVIQSAPLGHSFTGRQHPVPMSRHIANQPSNLSSTSHIHHVPANQTNNRLPPLSDVFGQSVSAHPDNAPQSLYPGNPRAPLASPGHPQQTQQMPTSGRPREFKSAEEAQHELAGGRPELLPKIVHYGGHQPPTPPSPVTGNRQPDGNRSASKRRTRAEYEDGGSPPLGYGPAPTRRGPFGEGRDTPETQRQKKDEFLRLCSRAWDLFHS
ncbi:hypothetical protein JDV02_001020 [Purpureocillium takamizusanense]|uniref:Uncharacterized protein n=1 Tax=Purpureocillium takamizusanense TaxID=2060973 RepID=A0A9Q8V655_9HYPO|nr:uncharacterized protein JDV02_001020 [Purpureocillium takamizusanense]UNI14388.1 hypothetical protein JDV02_001020 [Purpureocillium takamizusanense]